MYNSVAIQMVGLRAAVRAALEGYVTYTPDQQAFYDAEVKPLVLTLFDRNTSLGGDKVQVKVYATKQAESLEEGGFGPTTESFSFDIQQFPFEIAS